MDGAEFEAIKTARQSRNITAIRSGQDARLLHSRAATSSAQSGGHWAACTESAQVFTAKTEEWPLSTVLRLLCADCHIVTSCHSLHGSDCHKLSSCPVCRLRHPQPHQLLTQVRPVSAGGTDTSREGEGARSESHRVSVPTPSLQVVQSALLGHPQPDKLLGRGAVRVVENLLHHWERIGLHVVGCGRVCPAQLHEHGVLASLGPQLLLGGDDQLDLLVGKLEGVLELCLKHLLTLQSEPCLLGHV